ncbi:PAS domain S-box protein [Limnoglobus roseus]|uniref:histidine kinase n=1 Tax=Limnoglobus roseus TaxID=2598579 RepID=A0A5C1AP56_9BACT|nr:PAS domain S-box protein [Limnoglobus roseus]QEL19937.1 putative histidine kinase [Limnoglobus roseus]
MPASLPRDVIKGCALTVVAVAGVTLARWLLDPVLGESHPYVLFIFPAIYVANHAGWRLGAMALALGMLSANFLFAAPRMSFWVEAPENQVGLLIFLAVGGAGVYLADARRTAHARAEVHAAAAAAAAAAHHQTQDVLRKQQARLLDHAFDPVLTWELGRGITYWNAGAERLYGYTEAEAVGRVSHELLRTVFPAGQAAFEEAIRRDGRWEGELRHRAKDGRLIPVDSRMAVVQVGDAPAVVLEANRDTTERKRTEETQARLAAIVSSSDDAIISKDLGGVIQSWNAGAERLFGYTRGEAVGRPITLIIPPDLLDEEAAILARIRRGERTDHYETVRVAKGGRRVEVSLTVSPLRDADGNVVGASKVARDVTERKRSEDALRASESRFRNFVEQAADAFFLHDADGTILDVNRRACESLGFTREELVGMRVDVIDPHATLGVFRQVAEQLALGQLVSLDARHRRKDQATFPVEVRLSPFEADGRRLALAVVRDVTERRLAEDALRLRDRAIQAVPHGVVITTPTRPDNPITYASDGFERLTGYPQGEILGRNCRFLQGRDSDPAVISRVRDAVHAGRKCEAEVLNYRKDGTPFWNALSVTPVHDVQGGITHFVGVQTDVTERRKLEEQFRQAQKMEAVGLLASGVAHDFNNLLTVINGYSEMLLAGMMTGKSLGDAYAAIRDAGERAAGLTNQLLAFSRQSVLQPRVFDPNEIVAETGKMLTRLIGEDVRMTTTLDPMAGRVKVDPGQFGQVLMNLAVNARDAMPTGGRLTIETHRVVLDADGLMNRPDVHPGAYVMTAVSDTGSGMSDAVKARIFEPFFTTKGVGKGTGLGLAMVFGIIKQSGGHVEVYSELGIGTTVKVFLPAVEVRGEGTVAETVRIPGGEERVLLVEDQEDVRKIGVIALQTHGYDVIEGADGQDALGRVLRDHPPLDILVTDVVMPGMSGRQLAETVRTLYPGLKVLYTSGYTDDAVVRHGILHADVAFLRKPYTPHSLAQKVRDVLDQE